MKWKNLLPILFIMGCSQVDKKAGLEDIQKEQDNSLADFERANKLLDNKQFEEAARIYDQIHLRNPTNQLDLVIAFNSGLAHLYNGSCEIAEEKFRKIVRNGKTSFPELSGRALAKLGDAYACKGEDNKVIVTLIELSGGKFKLPPEILLAEVPAKLAAAYARIGNKKSAKIYFKRAERGLIQIQGSYAKKNDKLNILAKTLFFMGDMNQLRSAKLNSQDYFLTLTAMQKYLYKAIEFDQRDWSAQSAEQLIQAYNKTWDFISNVNGGEESDSVLRERELTRQKIAVAQESLVALYRLYDEHLPDPEEPRSVSEFINKMRVYERKLKNFIATNVVGTALTPEAVEANALKKAGQVLNPDPLLEHSTIQRSKKLKK